MSLPISNFDTPPVHSSRFAKTVPPQPQLNLKNILVGALGIAAIGAQTIHAQETTLNIIKVKVTSFDLNSISNLLILSEKVDKGIDNLKQLHQEKCNEIKIQDSCQGMLKKTISWLSGASLIGQLISLNWFTRPFFGSHPYAGAMAHSFAALLIYRWTNYGDEECAKDWDIIHSGLSDKMNSIEDTLRESYSLTFKDETLKSKSEFLKESYANMQKFDGLLKRMKKCYQEEFKTNKEKKCVLEDPVQIEPDQCSVEEVQCPLKESLQCMLD